MIQAVLERILFSNLATRDSRLVMFFFLCVCNVLTQKSGDIKKIILGILDPD